jgi:hypothetical protein
LNPEVQITLPEARVLGKPEDVSLEKWCKENGYTPHPLSILAEDINKKFLDK